MGGDAGGLLKFPAVISNVDASPFYYKCYRFFSDRGSNRITEELAENARARRRARSPRALARRRAAQGDRAGLSSPRPPSRAHVWGVVLTAEMTDVLTRVFYVRD